MSALPSAAHIRQPKDLVVLVADQDIEFTLRGLFARSQALEIRPFSFDIFRHHRRDPGCRTEGVDFLRRFSSQYAQALLMFDWEGSGGRGDADHLETDLEGQMTANGWERNAVVILRPELEQWVWSRSPQVEKTLGWNGPPLWEWLKTEGYLQGDAVKPSPPKDAFDKALRLARTPRSPSLFQDLATKVAFSGCQEPSFHKFRAKLQGWFPLTTPPA